MENKLFNLTDVVNKSNEFINYISKFRNVVYKFYCKCEDKSYIGITNNILYRLYSEDIGHLGTIRFNDPNFLGSRLQNAILKFEINNFEYTIVYSSDLYEEVDKLESFYIKKFNSCYNGYNCSTSGKICNGDIRVNNGSRCIFIKPNEVAEAADYGFNRRGSLSSSRIIVFDGLDFISIYKDEFREYEGKGFVRVDNKMDLNKISISYSTPERELEHMNFTISGKIGYTNLDTGKYTLIDPTEEYKYEENPSFVKGNPSNNLKSGQVFITKDGVNKRIDPSDLEKYILSGWSRGFKKRTKSKRMHLGDIEVCVPIDLVSTYKKKGFMEGAKKCRNTSLINPLTKEVRKVPRNSQEFSKLKSEGWKSTRKSPPSGKGSKYIYRNGKKTRVNSEDLDKFSEDL